MQGKLTARQQQVLDCIAAHIREHGYPPTIRELMRRFGIRSPNGTICHLKALEKKGFIKRGSCQSRAIQLVPQQSQASVTDQLRELIPVADKMGLGGAGDYLRKAIGSETVEE